MLKSIYKTIKVPLKSITRQDVIDDIENSKKLMTEIDNDNLCADIIKYMAPHMYLSKTKETN